MHANCYRISEDLKLVPCDYESAVSAIHDPAARTWIDLQGFAAGELEKELDKLDIEGMSRRMCLESRECPGFYPMQGLTFLVVPVQGVAGSLREVEYVAFIHRERVLITLRDARAAPLQRTVTVQESSGWLPDRTTEALVSALMVAFSLESLRRTAELREMIATLEERMDREPRTVETRQISDQRSELLTLESVVSAQLPVLQALLGSDRASMNAGRTREYLLFALANLQATDRTLEWLEGRIDLVRSLVVDHAQDDMNRALGRLTILSLIFMPMTLLAGIWGMNFQFMPELSLPSGYPVALGSMILVGAGTYLYFRRRGWFD